MKAIVFFIISSFCLAISAQEDSLKTSAKNNKDFHISIGVDVLNPATSFFSDKKEYSALLNLQLYKKWFVQAQLGYTNNVYEELGWNSEISGAFLKLGANYIITQDKETPNNMFYVGGKLGVSRFTQDLLQIPVRANEQTTIFTTLPKEDVTAYWIELAIGARVVLYKKLYAEAVLQPMIYLGDESDSGIQPVVIPSFGKDRSGFNINIFWGVTYDLF